MVKLNELDLIDYIRILANLTNFDFKNFLLKNRYIRYIEFGNLYNKIIENGVNETDLESFNESDKVNKLLDEYYYKSLLSKLELPNFRSRIGGYDYHNWGNWDMYDIKSKLLIKFGSYGINFIGRSQMIKDHLCDIVYNCFMNKIKNYNGGSREAFYDLTRENYNATYVFIKMIRNELKKKVTISDLAHIPMELLCLQFGMN